MYDREYRKADTKLQHGAENRLFVAPDANIAGQAAGIARGLIGHWRTDPAARPTKQKSCQTRLGSFLRLQGC
jgi:hypothetical protein